LTREISFNGIYLPMPETDENGVLNVGPDEDARRQQEFAIYILEQEKRENTARGAADNLRAAGVPVGAAAAEGGDRPGEGAGGEDPAPA
jgi:hypothetical protein